jgi:hypothetical protein
MSENR